MAKTGRPPKYRKDFHPEEFLRLSKKGKGITQIASVWDLDRDTLYDWGKKYAEFSGALKKGRMHLEAWYADLGQSAMLGQLRIEGKSTPLNLGMYVWLTKNICKWSDKVEMVPEEAKPEEYSPPESMKE